jgi:alpha-tubulin suppressor-like RCC1 family protein
MSAPLGFVRGCGNNNGRQLGTSGAPDIGNLTRLYVVVVPDTVTAVAMGTEHSLALGADGTVWTCGVLLKSMDKDPVQVSGLKSIIAIAAGDGFSLALRADGTVWSWGVNDKGQLGDGTNKPRKKPVPVKGLNNIVAIAAGITHVLALDVGGNVWAWGFNTTGQLGDGTVVSRPKPELVHNLDRVITIAAGGAHSLALRADGTVRAWGWNSKGQLGDGSTSDHGLPIQVPMLSSMVAIAAGGEHSLALHSSGTVRAWGANGFGQIGNDTTKDSQPNPTPVLAGPGSTESLNLITAIAAGETHSLAIRADGEARAWGYNNAGRLGDGTETDRHAPVAMKFVNGGVEYTAKVTALAGGAINTLAIVHTGGGWGWGANGSNQLGNPLITADESETAVHQQFDGAPKTIAAGAAHSLEISGGEGALGPTDIYNSGVGWAWGANDQEQVKPGDTSGQPLGMIATLGVGTAVAAGAQHSLGLSPDGIVYAWGANDRGQAGLGAASKPSSNILPVKGPGGDGLLSGVKAVAAGESHSLALKGDGTVWAWGANDGGQLGNNSLKDGPAPVEVKGPGGNGVLADIVAIAAGGQTSLALRADGTVWSWGVNDKGQLGNNAAIDHSATPVQVKAQLGDLPGMKAIAAGSAHCLALKADGTVWAWGWNSKGQLGDGSTSDRSTAAAVKGGKNLGAFLKNVKAIAAGGTMKQTAGGHSLALVAQGEVFGWGFNAEGQLGLDNLFADQSVPDVAVKTLTEPDPSLGGQQNIVPLPRVAAIAAGGLHSLAIGPDTPPKPVK